MSYSFVHPMSTDIFASTDASASSSEGPTTTSTAASTEPSPGCDDASSEPCATEAPLQADPGEAQHLFTSVDMLLYLSSLRFMIFARRVQYRSIVSELRAAPRGLSIADARDVARRAMPYRTFGGGDVWGEVRDELLTIVVAVAALTAEMELVWRMVQGLKGRGDGEWDERAKCDWSSARVAGCMVHYDRLVLGRFQNERVQESEEV